MARLLYHDVPLDTEVIVRFGEIGAITVRFQAL